ncbi:hypothetical protein AB205_0126750, partial [Aquarana catesbeiana]
MSTLGMRWRQPPVLTTASNREEEGDDADVSSAAPSMVSHKLPSSQPMHHFGSRYADMGGVGMPIRDAHEENPESILDEHVQRVMKTPGCQSPGPGRHSPKPRSPDGHLGKGLPVSMGTMQSGHGKHSGKSNSKLEASNLYHHKHVYHHVHHHGGVKPKEQIEAEATQRVQTNFPWNAEPHNYATKSRNYAESMGMAPNPMDSLGHSGKASVLAKRNAKKVDSGKLESANYEMPVVPEDAERNQKIMQWIMEGEKEITRHKKSVHRYYFKKVSDEFDCGVVFEEVRDEDTVLPIYEEKIIGKVEKID